MEEKSVLQKIQEGAKGFTESVEEGITPFIPPEIRKLKPSMDFVLSGAPECYSERRCKNATVF